MASLQWHNFRSSDMARPLSLEEIYRTYGAWSGIHDFSFDTLQADGTVEIIGTTGGVWTSTLVEEGLPANFTVKYHVDHYGHGLLISGTGILVFVLVEDDGDLFIGHDTTTPMQFIPMDNTPVEADVEVVFRQQTFDDVTGIVWRSVSLYMNGRWMTTYSDYLTTAYSDLQVGYMAYGTDTQDYTDILIPELGDTAEFGTLDPGEYALGGLQRTLEGRYLKNFIRFDGSLRAWKKRQRASAMTLNRVKGIQRTFDLPQLITHARMMGAYIWAEAVDADTIRLYGHRFQEVNNSMLLTQSECADEATNTLKRSQESAFGMRTQARHVPILEPEDRIEVDGESWIVKTYQFQQTGGKATQIYELQRYVWGD